MHDTVIQNGTVQSMMFRYGDRKWNSAVLVSDEFLGKPKGIKRILQERGLWREGLKKQCAREKKKNLKASTTQVPQAPTRKAAVSFEERQFRELLEGYETHTAGRSKAGKDCCALRMLEGQADFANEISLLEQVISEDGHQVIFYPKFHCELNYIEYY